MSEEKLISCLFCSWVFGTHADHLHTPISLFKSGLKIKRRYEGGYDARHDDLPMMSLVFSFETSLEVNVENSRESLIANAK